MSAQFKENIILLMQYTDLMRIPLSKLPESKKEIVHDLLAYIADVSADNDETMFDFMQLARLYYNIAELNGTCIDESNRRYYKRAIECIIKSGIDLSMEKWLELSYLRVTE